jgi:hypothetical protein
VSRFRRIRAVAAALAALLLVGVPVAVAAFTATTSNSGNSFQSASIFPGALKMATGTYTGDAVDGRAVSTGFQPDLVIVKASTNQIAVARTSTMSGDASKWLTGATALAADLIQSLSATGFTVGTGNGVNQNGTTYYWAAFKSNAGALKVGSYTGNGAASQAIGSIGFSPEYVAVLADSTRRAVQRFSGMSRGFQFDADVGTTTRITSLDADGFTVGNSAEVNQNNRTHHYVAFNDSSGSIDKGSYLGTGLDNTNVAADNFQPGYVLLRANDTATARPGHHRPAALAGDSTLYFENTANAPNRIQALQTNGFQVGTDGAVNTSGVTYHYLTVRNTAP